MSIMVGGIEKRKKFVASAIPKSIVAKDRCGPRQDYYCGMPPRGSRSRRAHSTHADIIVL